MDWYILRQMIQRMLHFPSYNTALMCRSRYTIWNLGMDVLKNLLVLVSTIHCRAVNGNRLPKIVLMFSKSAIRWQFVHIYSWFWKGMANFKSKKNQTHWIVCAICSSIQTKWSQRRTIKPSFSCITQPKFSHNIPAIITQHHEDFIVGCERHPH